MIISQTKAAAAMTEHKLIKPNVNNFGNPRVGFKEKNSVGCEID